MRVWADFCGDDGGDSAIFWNGVDDAGDWRRGGGDTGGACGEDDEAGDDFSNLADRGVYSDYGAVLLCGRDRSHGVLLADTGGDGGDWRAGAVYGDGAECELISRHKTTPQRKAGGVFTIS